MRHLIKTARALSRRELLLGTLALPALGPLSAFAKEGELSLALIGQCLIAHDLRMHPWPGYAALKARLRANDACFSDFEAVIQGPRAGAPTRVLDTLHTAEPVVLDCLTDLGVNLFATSNNHAYDLGTGGILDTMAALRERKLPFAGTGETLVAASAPAYRDTRNGRVAVVAAAAGAVREGGAATAQRAGVNELRSTSAGGLDAGDVQRMLDSLKLAARNSQVVIAYLHNHLWETDNSRTADWQREFARRCVDAGASVFVAHGAPLLHGVEMYRGAPLLHCLSSFIFQTRKAEGSYGDPNWESLIVECRFAGGKFQSARLVPVQLASVGVGGPDDMTTRGRPSPATSAQARATLDRLAALSQRLGHTLQRDGKVAILTRQS
ncbi:MAG: CapA family protein [Steroidobacteraceae bacterium]